jgi:stearoyl-CoA desaturase (Delta-9 desaturase)
MAKQLDQSSLISTQHAEDAPIIGTAESSREETALIANAQRGVRSNGVVETNILLANDAAIHSAEDAPRQGIKPEVKVGGPIARWHRREYLTLLVTKWTGIFLLVPWLLTFGSGWVEWSSFVFFYVVNMFGAAVGYHRFFAHRAFKTSRPMAYVIGSLAQMSAMGSALKWSADHHRHHSNTDRPGDVHSPFFDEHGTALTGWRSFFHSHVGWLLDDSYTDLTKASKAVTTDPVQLYCHRTRWFWYAFSLVIAPALWGLAFAGDWKSVVGCVLIGGALRNAGTHHAIMALNSLCHTTGYQNFKGPQNAQNNWFVAIVTLGEGWHNNHHHHASAAYTGIRWYEFDLMGAIILGMERVGLVWDVKRCPPYSEAEDGTLVLAR